MKFPNKIGKGFQQFNNRIMKKILLTGFAVAFFCAGTIAQVQDTASTNLRRGPEVQDQTQDQNNTSNELQRRTDETSNEIKQDAGEIKEDAQQTGNEIKQDAEKTGDQLKQEADKTQEKMEESTDRARDRASEAKPEASIENNARPTATDNSMGSTTAPQSEVEVIGDKEGPNNQVVYKYQDGFYYVDRDKKEFVKIEESQLQDAEHKAIVSDKNNKQ